MSFKIKTEVNGRIVKKKVDVSPMALYDPFLDESEIDIWKKPYAVDEDGVPKLFGDEKLLMQHENRKSKLNVVYIGQRTIKHQKSSWKVFITDYRFVMTIPANDAPGFLLKSGSVRPRTSLLRMAAAAAVHSAKVASARSKAGGYGVFTGFYTNLATGKIKLDKKNVNNKVEMRFVTPCLPLGNNAQFFPNGIWDHGQAAKVEIEQFSSEDEATKFLNQLYQNAVNIKKRYLEILKEQGRLSPEIKEDEILNKFNEIEADPISKRTYKEIVYHDFPFVNLAPFLPTNLEQFGVKFD